MSSNPPPGNPVIATELTLERWRELFAGILAVLIVAGMVIVGAIAVIYLSNADAFQRAKDLLLIITPFVGVVLGYYFNKVTSDARAAALQRAADSSAAVAITATEASQRAEMQAQSAQTDASKARGTLAAVVEAADKVGTSRGGTPGVLGADEAAITPAEIEFRLALERARQLLDSKG